MNDNRLKKKDVNNNNSDDKYCYYIIIILKPFILFRKKGVQSPIWMNKHVSAVN